MKPLFLVSSAIHTKHGVFSAEQRIQQTLNTFASINKYAPGAKIILIESSGSESISPEEAETLQPHLFGLLNFFHDNTVQQIYNSTDNWDIVKNFTELYVYGSALSFILGKQPHLLNDIDRVFKMSGRYLLNDGFIPATYDASALSDKYVFGVRRTSQFPITVTNGLSQQVMSRLWSWPANKTNLVKSRYELMVEDFSGTMHKGQYRDIEHLLLRYFDGPFLQELPVVGVEGLLGPNGIQVKD